MMTTEEIETSIVGRLEQEIEDAEVRAFPNDARSFFPKHPVGAVLVQYTSSVFSEPRALNSITQARTLRFSVFVLLRDLRDHTGVYAFLDKVRDSLTGFSLSGTSKMYQVSERFLSEQSGIWIYEMVFSLRATHEEKE